MSDKKDKIPVVASLEGHGSHVYSVAFHPTDKLLATGSSS